jgi:hypothetical protein
MSVEAREFIESDEVIVAVLHFHVRSQQRGGTGLGSGLGVLDAQRQDQADRTAWKQADPAVLGAEDSVILDPGKSEHPAGAGAAVAAPSAHHG